MSELEDIAIAVIAERDAEIARLHARIDAIAAKVPGAVTLEDAWQRRENELREAVELLRRIEPHIDRIICYASTAYEYEPNQLAADLYAFVARQEKP